MNDNDPSRSEKMVAAAREDFAILRERMTTGLDAKLAEWEAPDDLRLAVAIHMTGLTEYTRAIEVGMIGYIRSPGDPASPLAIPDFEPEKG